ncbi:hypothetical protein Pcinc_022520 [Petrolisthes cinctipes]|uniref:Uncharacterized protein n=1 Tax=Petrolisthes cinctipes TaxID=88211 RepID=A0AAE1KH00_PETCI|nr:hypothetical protein Pcinc_022520 [Petrolisthes cinctipes]
MALIKLVLAVVMVVSAVTLTSGKHVGHFQTKRAVLLDENFTPVADEVAVEGDVPVEVESLLRQRRDTGYGPPPKPHYNYKPGKVGPVYTFVKTDYQGNFKWGVRHRAGQKYAGGYH